MHTIEASSVAGATVRALAEKYEISYASIARHMKNCMAAKLAVAAKHRRDIMKAGDVLAGLTELQIVTQAQLEAAIARGDKPDTVARVIREARENFGMIGKLTGAFPRESGPTTTIDNRTQILSTDGLSVAEMREMLSALKGRTLENY